MNIEKYKRIFGLMLCITLVIFIIVVLIPPATSVYVSPGIPSMVELTVGETIIFTNITLTIRTPERIPVDLLRFDIFRTTDENIGYVEFSIYGEETTDYPSDSFTVTLIGPDPYFIDQSFGYGYPMWGFDEKEGVNKTFETGFGYCQNKNLHILDKPTYDKHH